MAQEKKRKGNVVETVEAYISTYEVYNLIQEHDVWRKKVITKVKQEQKKKWPQQQVRKRLFPPNWTSVENRVNNYIHKNTMVRHYKQENVDAFVKEIQIYNLTVPEQLQLLDVAPTLLVELHLVRIFLIAFIFQIR